MAHIRKRGKSYTAYIRQRVNGSQVTYATFSFGRVSKQTARDRLVLINRAEWRIIEGTLTEEDYPSWFPWLNDTGVMEQRLFRTLGETVDEFLEFKALEIRASSVRRIKFSMDRLLEVIPAKTKLETIKNPHIIKYRKHFYTIHRPAGMNSNLRNIKTLFRWCYDMEYMDRIPKIVIHKTYEEPKYLSEENLIKVLEACSPFYRSLFRVYLETGKRRSELVKGKIRGNLLSIPVTSGLKSKDKHSIKLNNRQLQVVNELHKIRDDYLAKGYKIDSFLNGLTKRFSRKLKQLGIYEKYKTKLHSLRHSQAVMTYLESSDVKSIMDKLHHSEIETSLGYAKIDKNDIEYDFPTSYECGEVAKKLQKSQMTDTFDRQLSELD
jgi:integrase